MKDFIIGSGQKLQYNPKTNKYSLKFNYDFDDNATEILKDPEKWNYKPGWNRLVMNLRLAFGGKYGLDGLGAPGRLIEIAKLFGGGKSVPGEISINADILQSINPTVIQDHIANITGVYPNSGEVWNPSMMGMPFGTGPVHNYYALTGQLPPGSVIQGSIPHNYGDHAEFDPAVIRAIDKAKGKAQQAPLPDDKTPLPNAPDNYDWRKDTVVRKKKVTKDT